MFPGTYVPEPMFPGSYVPRYLCSRTYVPRFLCSPVPMFPGTYVPEPMFPGSYVPRYLCSRTYVPRYLSALDISTGPLARRTFQTAGPVRASTFYLSLARTGHLDICRATRFQIVLARTMTIHSMYFSRGRPPHISAVFAQPFCYSETPVRVGHVNQTHCLDHAALQREHPGRIRALFSAKHMSWFRVNSFAFWSVNLKY